MKPDIFEHLNLSRRIIPNEMCESQYMISDHMQPRYHWIVQRTEHDIVLRIKNVITKLPD